MKTYNINEWKQTIKFIEKFKIIPKRNKIKLIIGLSCLAVAVFPNGLGFIFYPLGFMLLGIKKEFLLKKYEDFKFKVKVF